MMDPLTLLYATVARRKVVVMVVVHPGLASHELSMRHSVLEDISFGH
jgi:transketolase C-terminal domain/subunit